MIGFIGGTGDQGRALALRLGAAGEGVILGSRSREKAERVVQKIKEVKKDLDIRSATNEDAAENAEIVFITLPYRSMKATVEQLKGHLDGKIVVDVVNPLSNSGGGVSASEELQRVLEGSKVVCAFKNVSSYLIWNLDREVEVDSIVCSDFEDAKKEITGLSEKMGIPSIDGGGLENALATELLTRLLLQLNRKYNAETGVKILFYKSVEG